jgi:hypothetical protein
MANQTSVGGVDRLGVVDVERRSTLAHHNGSPCGGWGGAAVCGQARISQLLSGSTGAGEPIGSSPGAIISAARS